MMMRAIALSFAVGLAPLASAGAMETAEVLNAIDQALEASATALVDAAALGGSAQADAKLMEAIEKANDLLAAASTAEAVAALGKMGPAITKAAAAYQEKLAASRTAIDKPGANLVKWRKSLEKANKAAAKVSKAIVKAAESLAEAGNLGPVLILAGDPPTSGFYRPGAVAYFRAYTFGDDPFNTTLTVTARAGEGVLVSSGVLTPGADGRYSVTMGQSAGIATITAEWAGQTRTRPLVNMGMLTKGSGTLTLDYSVTGIVGAATVTKTGTLTFEQVLKDAEHSPAIPGYYHLKSDSGGLLTALFRKKIPDSMCFHDETVTKYVIAWTDGAAEVAMAFMVGSDNSLVGTAGSIGGTIVNAVITTADGTKYVGNVTGGTFAEGQ